MRRRLSLLVVSLIAPLAAALVVVPVGAPAQAIVGGSYAEPGEFPYAASMETADGGQFCGGSVVGRRWILTAAHCTVDTDPADVQVTVGKVTLSEPGGQTLAVDRLVVHPEYDAAELAHDIALWHTTTPIKAPAIRLVTARERRYVAPGTTLTVIGWGTEFFGAPFGSDRLKKVDVTTKADAGCDLNEPYEWDPPTHFCAETLGGDSCNGDSGGPIFARDAKGRPVQVGTVSTGIGCAVPVVGGVYADLTVPDMRAFITATTHRR